MVMHRRQSLRRKFILSLIGVVTIISVLFSALVTGYSYVKKEAELQQQLSQTLSLAETALQEAVWRGDRQSIRDILQAVLANHAVIYARVIIGDQLVISQAKPKHEETGFAEFQDPAAYLINSVDVRRNGDLIGKLQLVMSRDEINRETIATALSVVGLFSMLVMAILFTSLLILRRFIFQPLAKLKRSANLITDGNLDTQIDIDSSDEIGSLALAFRLMASHLEESFDNLERKVIERTVDLSQAKISAEKTSRHLLVVSAELQALLDNSPVGILFIDNQRVIQRINKEMEKITGYSSDELVGHTTALLSGQDTMDAAATEKFFPELTKKGFCEKRAALLRKDGSEIACWLRGRAIPVSKELEGVIWSVEDITSRLQMEQELLKAKKQESIGVLAGGIAHDFNNILFAVIGNLSLAERLETGPAQEHIRAARKAAMRAKELTAKLLTFAVGGDPVRATGSLPELVRDAAGFVLSGSNVKCTFQTPDDLWPVSMDKEQISQVIQDLVRNANQSMPEGGIILISFANRQLDEDDVIGLYPGRYVCVSLTDRGRGIERQNLDRIFDPYFSTKGKNSTKGSGLGLAIVHSIVTKHDGRITVDSIPGQGTTFTLYLPARSRESATTAGRAAIVPSGKGSVLVQDAGKENLELVCDMLAHMGYRGQPVSKGREAVALYRDLIANGGGFYAVIVDMDPPGGMEGREVIAALHKLDPKVNILVSVSSLNDLQQEETCRELGVSGCVTKPYKLLELNRVLSSLAGKQKPVHVLNAERPAVQRN